MYTIIDNQQSSYLEGDEKTLRDVVERLISFHSIDCNMKGWTIHDLIELGWSIVPANTPPSYNYNVPDLTHKLIKKYKQGKGRRQFKKIISKYNNYEEN